MSVLKDKNNLIKQIEIYEWWQREEDIAAIFKMREMLTKKQTYVFTSLNQQRMQKRLDTLISIKKQEMDKKMDQINKKKDRELRKLAARQNKKPKDVIDTYNNYTSELYMKNRTKGINSKYQNRLKMNMTERQLQKDLGFVDSVDELLNRSDIETKAKPKTQSVCPQEKKWNVESLIELFNTVRQPVLSCSSWEDRDFAKKTEEFMYESANNDDFNPEDERYLNAVLIEKFLRGRKWQTDVQERMAKTQYMIDEIKETMALTGEDIEALEDDKQVVLDKTREEEMKEKRKDALDNVQGQLQGETISAVLDFLSKELLRLQDERNAHADSLLAERQRELREAIESGKRQREIERRKEFDEMFKQIVKIKQDSVDNYLESVLMDSVQCTSDDQARRFIQEKAKVIDLQAQEAFLRRDKMEDEAIIADLLYNVAIPEVENIRVHTCEKQAQKIATKGKCRRFV
uniref:Protein MAATS1 n=2 Tax=Cacopsylla melanoneura TaxID=428564 RepID=A0A8D9A4S6_9HEMI